MANTNNKRNDISICALIALTFLWTGCAYLTWFYHLAEFYASYMVDLFTEVIGYVFQAAGLVFFSIYKKKASSGIGGRFSFALLSLTGLGLGLLASMSPSGPPSLVFGYGMNTVFGIIAGYYLQILADRASGSHMGIIFGAGYGAGSVLSYLISLLGSGNFLARHAAFALYAVICAAAVLLSYYIAGESSTGRQTPFAAGGRPPAAAPSPNSSHQSSTCASRPQSTRTQKPLSSIWLPGIAILILSFVKSGGFYFPAADLAGYNVSLELSRSFYAAGLIAAGFVNDKRRSAGAVLCVASLIFPFFTMLTGTGGVSYALWISGYVFFGFYSVYRVLLFTDISQQSPAFSHFACMGLMWGRLGDAVGAACGIALSSRPVVLITIIAILFEVCIFLFFHLYQTLYMPGAKKQDYVMQFVNHYSLSQRESDLLRLILNGNTNKEIAEQLFISENTVKFHVRNLLRKTGCSRRSELLALFESFRRD